MTLECHNYAMLRLVFVKQPAMMFHNDCALIGVPGHQPRGEVRVQLGERPARYDYVSTGSLRRGKTDQCSLSFRPFQAPRTQPKQERHSWRPLRSAISPLLRLASLAS
jgi:hypothetical protein